MSSHAAAMKEVASGTVNVPLCSCADFRGPTNRSLSSFSFSFSRSGENENDPALGSFVGPARETSAREVNALHLRSINDTRNRRASMWPHPLRCGEATFRISRSEPFLTASSMDAATFHRERRAFVNRRRARRSKSSSTADAKSQRLGGIVPVGNTPLSAARRCRWSRFSRD